MAQKDLNQLVALMLTLSVAEQDYVFAQINIHRNQPEVSKSNTLELEELHPFSWDELRERLNHSLEEIERGEVYSEEESDKMMDMYVKQHYGVAV